MAVDDRELEAKEAKRQIKEDRKALKQEQAMQKKEARARAKEISERENDIDDGDAGGLSVFMVTLMIIIIWIAILALLIKLDVGGFGNNVVRPVIKDIPVIKMILPAESNLATNVEVSNEDPNMGFTSVEDAVTYIRQLEYELQLAKNTNSGDSERVEALEAEITRLKTFENSQVEFERIKNEFYDEVIYGDKAPDIEEYKKYYEGINPERAEILYQQVIKQVQMDSEMKDYVDTYSAMKPKEAAAIFEAMTDNLALAARILENMDSDSRGKILGAMDSEVAAKITKLMDPQY